MPAAHGRQRKPDAGAHQGNARAIAARDLSTSSCSVVQFVTEIRMAAWPLQVVVPIQQVPSCCRRLAIVRVQPS
jgi:hypothetical protein